MTFSNLFPEDINKQRGWSDKTFGPGERLKGVLRHIKKELREVRAEPKAVGEWADLLVLTIDGATRQGISGYDLLRAYHAKMHRNFEREWPDWRESSEDKPIEHKRAEGEGEKATVTLGDIRDDLEDLIAEGAHPGSIDWVLHHQIEWPEDEPQEVLCATNHTGLGDPRFASLAERPPAERGDWG